MLTVVYLLYNAGRASTAEPDLCLEAIRLARPLASVIPDEPEVDGLLALLLLTKSRRAARSRPHGSLVVLGEQDRSPHTSSSRPSYRRPPLTDVSVGLRSPKIQEVMAQGRSTSTRIPSLVLLLNVIVRGILRLGVSLGPATLLTVRGHTSGLPRTTPVVLFENTGHRWLIAVFGDVNWVRNLRAAGQGILTRGHRRQKVVAVELTAEAAGPVLKDVLEPFLKRRPRARRMLRTYYHVAPDASLNEFINEARRHPVFEVRESRLP